MSTPNIFKRPLPKNKIRVFSNGFRWMQKAAYNGSEIRGFHEQKNNPLFVAAALALIGSEVSEALECDRKGQRDEMPGELADIIIRTMDLAEHLGINLGLAVKKKHEFNNMRPYKHGNNRY